MKRVITVFLLVAMLLSITACGNKITNDSSANAAQASDAAPTESPVATNSASPSPTPKDETAETLVRLKSALWRDDGQVMMYYEFFENGVVIPQCSGNGQMSGRKASYKVIGNNVTITYPDDSSTLKLRYSNEDMCLVPIPEADETEDPDDIEGGIVRLIPTTYKEFYTAWATDIVSMENYYSNASINQTDLTNGVSDIYIDWDKLLNKIYNHLKGTLSASDFSKLQSTEKKWIIRKNAAIDLAGKENEGGSIQPLLRCEKGAELTKQRVYELIEMVSN